MLVQIIQFILLLGPPFKGLNDRMALGDYNSRKVYADRINYVNNYLGNYQQTIVERFLKYVLDNTI